MHAPGHTLDAGVLDRLVREPDFLVGTSPAAMRRVVRGFPSSGRRDPVSIYGVALAFLSDEPGVNAVVLEFVSRTQGSRALSKALGELRVNRP
jgi:hypothetical protein